MRYAKEAGRIVIEDPSEFDPKHIFDCGQAFRYLKAGDCYTVFAKSYKCLLRNEDGYAIIETDNIDYFRDYFDLERDYAALKKKLTGKYDGLKSAVEFGSGIRILNQDPFETIISFIISANNNIPRIKGIIERLCEGLGEERGGYYAFPAPERMCRAEESFYRSIGAGYRSEYLVKASRRLADADFAELGRLSTDEARKRLLGISGVGPKVADCVLLFAYGKTDLFPMDVWSRRAYRDLGMTPDGNASRMSGRLVEKFGDLAGYAQQYLYYYYRENKLT